MRNIVAFFGVLLLGWVQARSLTPIDRKTRNIEDIINILQVVQMKLELSRVVQGCRLGVLTGLGRTGEHRLEIPGCLLYTRCGSVPHLTQDVLHTLRDLPAVSQLPLGTVAEHQEVLETFQKGAAKFAGLHDTVLYCSLHDPAKPSPAGYNTNKTVSVWSSGGRIELNVGQYMALQTAVRPDWYQSMADGESHSHTSHKRVRKAVDRTLAHLDQCLDIHHKTQELNGAEILGVVEGGDVLEERVRSARETAKRPVAGFVLDGFQPTGMNHELRHQLITAVTTELPQDKPRLLQGEGRPDQVLACLGAGVDLFETSFPFLVTERGCALCFDFNINSDPEGTALTQNGAVVETSEVPEEKDDLEKDHVTRFEMNLKDKRYRDDLRPLVADCECYCCRHHHRAYLHHLLVTKELLAGVLLMVHNLAHYCGFFSALRRALASEQLEELKSRVLREVCHGPL